MADPLPLTIALPTYGRDEVLVNTVEQLLAQDPPASEILVLDQTPEHAPETESRLRDLHDREEIRWMRLKKPSQPGALNVGLRAAAQPIILFLDDDIRVDAGFLQAHVRTYDAPSVTAVAGQVLQPDQEPVPGGPRPRDDGPFADLDFPFHSDRRVWVRNGMSGNLSVRRDAAVEIGGFDENFVGHIAYRFDAEFCKRLCRSGRRIRFEPEARIHHLRAGRGGTRTTGSHLMSMSPMYGVGDYYFAFRQGLSASVLWYVIRRPFREVRTRFHLARPWWIPVKLLGEFRAMAWAFLLVCRGPKYVSASTGQEGAT